MIILKCDFLIYTYIVIMVSFTINLVSLYQLIYRLQTTACSQALLSFSLLLTCTEKMRLMKPLANIKKKWVTSSLVPRPSLPTFNVLCEILKSWEREGLVTRLGNITVIRYAHCIGLKQQLYTCTS